MKRVYLYVGQHQRLQGEVKKLAKPLGIIRRRRKREDDCSEVSVMSKAASTSESDVRLGGEHGKDDSDELEIVEIIRWKLVFSNRPEPVGIGD